MARYLYSNSCHDIVGKLNVARPLSQIIAPVVGNHLAPVSAPAPVGKNHRRPSQDSPDILAYSGRLITFGMFLVPLMRMQIRIQVDCVTFRPVGKQFTKTSVFIHPAHVNSSIWVCLWCWVGVGWVWEGKWVTTRTGNGACFQTESGRASPKETTWRVNLLQNASHKIELSTLSPIVQTIRIYPKVYLQITWRPLAKAPAPIVKSTGARRLLCPSLAAPCTHVCGWRGKHLVYAWNKASYPRYFGHFGNVSRNDYRNFGI